MLSSPAKRRKTSETTAASVDASQENQQAHENNSRIRPSPRPSFQSPTKASLARSHPGILARAISRSPTRPASRGDKNNGHEQESAESRLFGLRDRKALRPSLASNASPAEGLQMSPRRQSTAFTAPPRRGSSKVGPADITFGTPEAARSQNTPDLPPEGSPEDQLASELDDATGDVTTADSVNPDPEPSSAQQAFQEPELPPTPTQLGLEKPPGRPKGLSSSSPIAQYEKRARRRIGDPPKPSPLNFRSLDTGREPDREPDEAPETGPTTDQILLPEPALKSKAQKEKKELSAELQRLKDEVAELETWTEKLEQPGKAFAPTDKELSKLISLLSSENAPQKRPESQTNPPISSILSTLLPFSTKAPPKPREESPPPTNPFALEEQAHSKQYLTVFAPLTLTSHSSKVSASKTDSLTETRELTLSAAPPFPPKLYNATVIYEANPETQSLLSISVPGSRNGNESNLPDSLRHWINTRLSNPLLKLDISGLCWGINQYWEAAVSRAQIWSQVESQHSHLLAGGNRNRNNGSQTEKDNLSIPKLRRLIPHLHRTTMTFNSPNDESSIRVLISCTLTLDEWTSEPQLLPEISISALAPNRSASSKKIEQETKKLFYTLLKGDKDDAGSADAGAASEIDVGVVVRAVDGVLGVLFGLDAQQQQQQQQQQRMKGKLPVR